MRSTFKTKALLAGAWTVAQVAALQVAALAQTQEGAAAPTLKDMVEVVTIDSLSISPDGTQVGFRQIAPSLETSSTKVQWYRVPLTGSTSAIALGRASEPIWMPEFDFVIDGASQWDPDSKSLFVLQLDGDQIQVHRLADNLSDIRITHDDADAVSFSLQGDGSRLTYQVRNTRAEISRAQREEERRGVHFDRTVFPEGLRLTRNFRVGTRETTIRRGTAAESLDLGIEAFAGDLRTKELVLRQPLPSGRNPTTEALRNGYLDVGKAEDAKRTLTFGSSGTAVRLVETAAPNALGLSTYAITATLPDGTSRTCAAAFCRGMSSSLREIALNDKTEEVVVLYEKDFSARSEIYGWQPRTGRVRLVYRANGSLDGGSSYSGSVCPKVDAYLVCVHAGPTQPPRLIRIDLDTGRASVLADPNAMLSRKRYAKADYIEWRDTRGRPSNGILMMPANVRGPVPLVITTYRCRGFLRGGTAMVAAEHLLTQLGFATLCANNNNAAVLERDASGKRIPAGGAKAALEGYHAIVDILVDRGLVDRNKVGIAGHSFSSNAIAYAISHSTLFAAAVMSGGTTLDPIAYPVTAPTAASLRKDVFTELGLPNPAQDVDGIWKEVSPALNADRIRAALLMQPPENEWLFTLQLFSAIEDAGGTVDMYIYPDEGHNANRDPIHHYWRNRRSIEWFCRWLMTDARSSCPPIE